MGVGAGPWYIDDTLTFTAITHRFDTGALTDADSVPSYRIYEDETGTAILNGSMAKLDDTNTTGFYSEQITLSAANGFEVGKSYSVYISAAVNSVTGGQTVNFKVIAAPTAPPTAAAIADAVWDENATGHQTGGTFGQAIGDPGADSNTIYSAVVTGAAGATIAADIIAVKAETADILADTAEIGVAGAGLTNINLPNQTMDIVGNITGNLSGSVGSVTGNVGGNVTGSVGSIATGGIAAASFAAGAVDAAALAADAGTEIATAVWGASTRSLTILDEDSTTLDLDATIRAAVGLASANLDTQLGAIDDAVDTEVGTLVTNVATVVAAVDTEVAAIKAKTDNLPASPAATGDIPTANQNADALLDRADAIEVGLTVRQTMRLSAAADAGKISGAATSTNTIRNAVADSKDRIVATVDAAGNRTAIAYDLT